MRLTVTHLRAAGLSDAQIIKVIEEAEAGMTARMNDAIKDLWGRMFEVVNNMQQRLAIPHGEKGGKFHDTLVGNMAELAAMLPQLNITNDPEIAAMGAALGQLSAYPAEMLRVSPDARAAAQTKAAELVKRMAQYV